MAKVRQDAVLGKAVSSDATAVPRYNLVNTAGRIVAAKVQLQLTNPVIQEGMPVDKAAMDECLAASGTTAGSATAFTLAQDNFALFDGALVRIKLHVDSGATPTLNINGTGAKALMQSKTKPFKAGTPAGTWVTFVYSSDFGFFLQQGSGGGSNLRFGNEPGQISSFELMFCGHNDPSTYKRPF